MARRGWWTVGVLVLWSTLSPSQTYGPGEIYYGGIRVQFSGQVQVTGTCSGPYQVGLGISELRCEVQAGTPARIVLTATRTPAGSVNVRAEALPAGWPPFPVASGWGTITAPYDFTVPSTPGQTHTLRFRAWTPGVVGELELRVVLTVRAAPPPPEPGVPPTYGPFTGTTDAAGRFEIPIPTMPNTSVTGTLTECTVRVLPRTQVSVILVPKTGVTAITRADQIGAVRVSSPGYPETTVTQLGLASSMDMFGRVSTTVGLGTVCLRPPAPGTPPTYGPVTGKTDAEGKFTGTLAPGVTVSGRLTECTVKPLPNKEFTLTSVPKGETITGPEDIAGFKFSVLGYQETTITKFSWFSLFGLTSFLLGDLCLVPALPPPLLAPPCACTNLTLAPGTPTITGWLRALEPAGERAWVQVDVSFPITWALDCGPQPPPSQCTATIQVQAAAKFDVKGFVPAADQQRLWTTEIRCTGPCPGRREFKSHVRYSFIVEAKQIIGIPMAEVLPYKGEIEFTLTPNCPGAAALIPPIQVKVPVGVGVPGGGVPPNPNPPPPPPPPPPIALPLDPTIERDPYVAEIEGVYPVRDGVSIHVRVGNAGNQEARARLEVMVVLADGSQARGVMDDLVLPAHVEYTVEITISVPSIPAGSVWPPVEAIKAELQPLRQDANRDNNSTEWP